MILEFDYSRLKAKIKAKIGSLGKLSRELGMTQKTLSLKLNNKSFFNQKEITKILYLLDIDPIWTKEYFFTFKV